MFRLRETHKVLVMTTQSMGPAQKHKGQNVREHVRLGANKTVFVDMEMGTSCNFCVMKYSYDSFQPSRNIKTFLSSLAIQKWVARQTQLTDRGLPTSVPKFQVFLEKALLSHIPKIPLHFSLQSLSPRGGSRILFSFPKGDS